MWLLGPLWPRWMLCKASSSAHDNSSLHIARMWSGRGLWARGCTWAALQKGKRPSKGFIVHVPFRDYTVSPRRSLQAAVEWQQRCSAVSQTRCIRVQFREMLFAVVADSLVASRSFLSQGHPAIRGRLQPPLPGRCGMRFVNDPPAGTQMQTEACTSSH